MPLKRQLSDGERSVLLSELLLRRPELVAEAEETTSALLVAENDQELADEITARLRALRASGPVSVDTGWRRVLNVLEPYIDDLTRRKECGARRAAADIAIAVLLRLYRPEILPRLQVRPASEIIAVHQTCSLVREKLTKPLITLVAALSPNVFTPPSWGCCAFAGPRSPAP